MPSFLSRCAIISSNSWQPSRTKRGPQPLVSARTVSSRLFGRKRTRLLVPNELLDSLVIPEIIEPPVFPQESGVRLECEVGGEEVHGGVRLSEKEPGVGLVVRESGIGGLPIGCLDQDVSTIP